MRSSFMQENLMKSFYLLLRTFSYIPLSVLEGKEIYTERSIARYGTCNIGNPISNSVQRYAPFPQTIATQISIFWLHCLI